jgi:uncharacterized cupredoxin-like copper-binding protein
VRLDSELPAWAHTQEDIVIRGFTRSLKATSTLLLSGALLAGAAATGYAQATQTFSVTLDGTGTPFAIRGAPATVRAGTPLVFNARNAGPDGDTAGRNTHNLAIDGNGVDFDPTTPNLTGGQSRTITFAALQPGTYHLYCPVGQHRNNGMDVTFTVVASTSALPRTGGAALPLGLGAAGLLSGAAGLYLRRRAA